MWGDEESSVVQCLNRLFETTQSLNQLQLHWPDQVLSFPDDKSEKLEKKAEVVLLGGLYITQDSMTYYFK